MVPFGGRGSARCVTMTTTFGPPHLKVGAGFHIRGVTGLVDKGSDRRDLSPQVRGSPPVLLVAVVILSVVTVRPAGGSLAALGRVHLRYAPAIFGALAIQIAIISVVPGGSPGLHRVLYVGSYALAAVFVVANRRLAGMRMLALGATLNLVAILANSGVMPAARSALRTAGILSTLAAS